MKPTHRPRKVVRSPSSPSVAPLAEAVSETQAAGGPQGGQAGQLGGGLGGPTKLQPDPHRRTKAEYYTSDGILYVCVRGWVWMGRARHARTHARGCRVRLQAAAPPLTVPWRLPALLTTRRHLRPGPCRASACARGSCTARRKSSSRRHWRRRRR